MKVVTAKSNNKLVHSPHYGTILREYNERFARDGKVNAKQFHEEVVSSLLPHYKLHTWYAFLKRFETSAGLIAANAHQTAPPADPTQEARTLLSNNQATVIGIQSALNIGAARLKELLENPELMTAKEAADLFFKAMKAQDSRIHAVGKIREDNREQEKFDRAFDGATYAD